MAVCHACLLRTFVKSQRCLQQHARAAEEQRKARIESAETDVRSARKDMKPLKTIPSISKTAAQSVAKVTPAEPITTSAEEPIWFPSAPDGEPAKEERDPVVRDPSTALPSSTYTTDTSIQSAVTVSCVTPTAQQKPNREQKKAQHYSEQFRLSVSVMVVIAVFVLCWFPFCVSMLLSLFAPHWLSHATDMAILLLGFSNSCFNPIIYGLMNRRVRDAYIKMWINVRRALL
ncbi:alpha-2B adrenergic receptor-like [Littorina saxatilis]|uniref:alpha-2B adrenergic receptor-like n=1 Tax=Littorina saxatilis TaxID=31220 RepID=UPI0038B65564